MSGLKGSLIFLCLTGLSLAANSPGEPWTSGEESIVREKLVSFMKSPSKSINELQKSNPEVKKLGTWTRPNLAKVLRLGFHDCLPYVEDELEAGQISGCDGCLNPTGMATDLLTKFGGKGESKGPEITFTNNNGLMYTADLLEEMYTNPDFPKKTTSLGSKSLKELGKSRADLWALASIVATEMGIENNNLACKGQWPRSKNANWPNGCDALRANEAGCSIEMPRPFAFKTGRTDCTPDLTVSPEGMSSRPYFTSKHEVHPNAHGNGIATVDFYKESFGLTARESIALTGGAHSLGKFNSANGYFRYSWTRLQESHLNNQLFRHYGERPQYFIECRGGQKRVGDAWGNKANTDWQVNLGKFSQSGGPFQWFHRYDRCPASNDCSAIDEIVQDRAEPNTPSRCCKNLEEGMKCQPDCQRRIQNDETALPAEVGFYRHFLFNETTGLPYGCPGFDNDPKWLQGKKASIQVDCRLEDYAPEGEPLYQIVDEFADDQKAWMEDFVPSIEKMLENGYESEDLTAQRWDG